MKKISLSLLSCVCVCCLISIIFVKNLGNNYSRANELTWYLFKHAGELHAIENRYNDLFWKKQSLINLNGRLAGLLGIRSYFKNKNIYVTSDKWITGWYGKTSTDYEIEQITDFRNFLDENGIKLLYVNEPVKYIDDSVFEKEFGMASYSNRNLDLFLSRLDKAGIHYIDLREGIKAERLDVKKLFYRTDHHWTTPAGLWATKKIAKGMNDCCGYSIDTSIYDEANYTFTEWKNCWLGEQGRLIAESYAGRDDYTEVKPKFKTSFLFKDNNGLEEGTFDGFVNERVYAPESNMNATPSWHYSYLRRNVINNKVDYGKVLLMGDSYDHVVAPFLSLAVHECDFIILRAYPETFDLRKFILDNGYDTVLICYAQFMVGAHDYKGANYRMFTFH